MNNMIKFYNPTTGYEMDDFQTKIMEVVMEMYSDHQDLDTLVLDTMVEVGTKDSDTEGALVKLVGGLRCLKELIASNRETFNLFLQEREQYKTQKLCTEI